MVDGKILACHILLYYLYILIYKHCVAMFYIRICWLLEVDSILSIGIQGWKVLLILVCRCLTNCSEIYNLKTSIFVAFKHLSSREFKVLI